MQFQPRMNFIPVRNNPAIAKFLFFAFPLLVVAVMWSASIALLLGLFLAIIFGYAIPGQTSMIIKYLLQISINGLGFRMKYGSLLSAGRDRFVFMLLTISPTMGIVNILGSFFK